MATDKSERSDYPAVRSMLASAGYIAIKCEHIFEVRGRECGELGMPDWLVILPRGRVVFVEQKARRYSDPEKQLDPEQRKWIAKAALLGHRVIVANSPLAILRAVIEYDRSTHGQADHYPGDVSGIGNRDGKESSDGNAVRQGDQPSKKDHPAAARVRPANARAYSGLRDGVGPKQLHGRRAKDGGR